MMRTKRPLAFIGLALLLLAMAPAWTGLTQGSFAAPQDNAHADGAHAGDHGGDHGEPGPIAPPKQGAITGIMALLVFVVVFAILYWKVWPQIAGGLDERATKIRDEIASAEAARKQAKMALDEYEKNLAEARAESQRMIEETRAQQSQLAAQLKANADAELSAMREKALAEIDGAKKQALNELYNESVNLATVMAGKILQRQVTVEDQQRLMDESIEEMKSVS